MLLTITLTSRRPPTSATCCTRTRVGVHTRPLAFGPSHVFYPEATDERCTAALLLDIDPVGLVRGRRPGPSLEPYVNDRPYVASSFLSVALADQFGTAMNGRSKERQELADQALPFEVGIPVLPARGGDALIRKLFEPLGYTVDVAPATRSTRRSPSGARRRTQPSRSRATSGSATCSRTCTC